MNIVTTTVPEISRRKVVIPYTTHVDLNNNIYEICVPKDFMYDGTSIPSPFWIIFGTPYDTSNDTPGCVHDYLYNKNSNSSVICNGTRVTLSRNQADRVFYILLCRNGVCKIKAYIMYIAVVVFGFFFYKDRVRKILKFPCLVFKLINNCATLLEGSAVPKYALPTY